MTLLQIFFALLYFLYVVADLSTVLNNFFLACSATNILSQLGTIFDQLITIFLQLLAVFPNVFARLANIPNVPANFASAGIPRTVKDVMSKAAIVQLAVAPSSVIGDQIGAPRNLPAQNSARSRRRLMARRSAWKPNTTATRRWHMTWGNVKVVVIFRHRGGCWCQQSSSKKPR